MLLIHFIQLLGALERQLFSDEALLFRGLDALLHFLRVLLEARKHLVAFRQRLLQLLELISICIHLLL